MSNGKTCFPERHRFVHDHIQNKDLIRDHQHNRDKVYHITKYIDKDKIYNHVNKVLGNEFKLDSKDFSFYHFSKSNAVSPIIMEKDIIEPLFSQIADKKTNEKAYLDWNDIKEHFLENEFVTIVNHSINHSNMSMFSREEVFNDITESTNSFIKKLNYKPLYYAAPFGGITPNLLIDINDCIRENNYQGALWANGYTNILNNKYESQVVHLSRINTPTSFTQFIINFFISLTKTYILIMNQIPKNKTQNQETYEVIAGNDPHPALCIENLVSQGKDYSSNEKYYKYLHTDNIYKKHKPDYYAIISS